MADPSWLDKNNITSVRLKTSTGTVEIGQLEAFGLFGQTFLVILYSLSTFFALTGNTLVILVEIYGRRSARNLQKFLINLAISDLLLGVLVTPFIYTDIMLGRWIFHPLLCPVTQFVQLMSVFVTTYTLTFIGIERYFATLHPLSSANTWLRSHGNLVLQLSWIFGSILASFSIQNTRVVAFNYNSQTYYDCANWVDVAERDMQIYVTLSFVLTFVLPIIFLTISYGAIGRRLMRTQKYWCSYRQTIPFSSHHHSHSHHNNQNSTSRTHSNNNSNSSHNHNPNTVDNNDQGNNNNPTVTATVAAPSVTTTTTRKNNKSLIRKNFTKISKLSNSNVHHQTNGNGNDDNNTTTVTTSNNSLNKKSNNKNQNKVIVRFDKRNAEFLNKMRVFRLLVAVLVLFIICWLPIKIFMLILAFRPSIVYLDSMTNYYIYYISFFLCHWLSMANSFANPILYCFMSKSFRADLCDLFVCICTKLNICIKSCETLKENHHPHHHTGGNHHHHQQHYHHHNDYHDQQRNPLHYKSLLYDHPNDKIKIQEKLQQQQPQKPYNYCLASIKESNITNPNLEDDDNDIDNELIDPSIKKLTLRKQHSSSSLESLEQIDQLPIPLVITTTTQSSQSSSELHRSPQTSSSPSSSDWKNKQLKFINCKHKFLSINSTNDVNDPDDDIDVVVENIPVVVVEQQQQQASKVFAFFKLNSMSK